MKHLKKIFESSDITKEDILENFIYISDKFGEPTITTSVYGKLTKWIISWNIQLNLSELQEADKFILKLKDLVEDIDDILAAQDRLENYNINIALDNKLKLELIPKDAGDSDYEFISHLDGRLLYVRINEIERFLNSKGMRILKWVTSDYDELYKSNNLNIYIANVNDQVNELRRLINLELGDIDDKEYKCRSIRGGITIEPLEEKAFINVIEK
jgi:hypothetical protein